MKRVILLVVTSLFLEVVAAKSVQSNLDDDLVLIFNQGQTRDLGRRGVYNYATDSRVKSIGLMHNIQVTPAVNAGFGLMFGGIELELETKESMVEFRGFDIDIDSLLGVNAKVTFADIIPYVNLGYYIEDRKQRLSFTANAGIKLLMLSNVSVSLDGEIGDQYEAQDGILSRLHQEVSKDIKDYYLETVLQMSMNYVFN